MRPFTYLLNLAVLATVVSCQSEEMPDFNKEITTSIQDICLEPDLPVCMRYETLNEAGQAVLEFSQSENIVVSFEIINKSDQDIYLQNTDGIFLSNPNFMRITDAEGNEISHLTANIAFTYPAYFIISKRAGYKFQISYYNDSMLVGRSFSPDGGFPIKPPMTEMATPELPEGEYSSSFTNQYIFKIEGEERKYRFSLPLSLNFSVQ